MNLFSIQEAINVYKKVIQESGFQRDLQDYIQTIPQSANNSEILRGIGSKLEKALASFQNEGIAEQMEKIIPNQFAASVFIKSDLDRIIALNSDPQIQLPAYYQTISNYANDLNTKCQAVSIAVAKIEEFIRPYLSTKDVGKSDAGKGIISLIFKDKTAIGNLTRFTKELENWRKVLPIFEALITKSSPEDIELIDVQSGSIDVIVNLDVNVALNLADLFAMAVKGYAAYLAYKVASRIYDVAIQGNPRYEQLETERHDMFLNNILQSVKSLLEKQVDEENQTPTNKESLPKKLELIASTVTNHVIKGNEIKLLSFDASAVSDESEVKMKLEQTRVNLVEARRDIKLVDQTTKTKLLTQFNIFDQETEEQLPRHDPS